MTGSRPDTWMPFYVGDYLRDTARLTTEGHGAYLLLILDYWINGPLPDEDEQLAAVARMPAKTWKRLRPTIERFFQIEGGRWRHKRIDKELARAALKSKERSETGKKGAEARWSKDAEPTASGNGSANAKANGSGNGSGYAGPMAKRWQNDAPSQSQRKTPPSPPPAGTFDEATEIAGGFHRLVAHHWGGDPRNPSPKELSIARGWVQRGAKSDPVCDLMNERMERMARDGKQPPGGLWFFDQPVTQTLGRAA